MAKRASYLMIAKADTRFMPYRINDVETGLNVATFRFRRQALACMKDLSIAYPTREALIANGRPREIIMKHSGSRIYA